VNLKKGRHALIAALIAVAGPASADFPEQAVSIMVPYNPGGTSDTLTRALVPYLEAELGTEVVVVNTAGGGGAVGWTGLAGAEPDGYTIGHYSNAMAVLEATGSATFTHEDFTPIARFGNVYLTVTALGEGPYASLEDYVSAASEAPGEISLAMGRGTLSQFVAAEFEEGIGADLQLVNAGGGADKKAALLGGHVDAIVEPTPGVFSQHEAGEFRILAVLAPERLTFAPDLPTATEAGYDVVAPFVAGFIGPAGISEEELGILSAAIERAVANPEYVEQAAALMQEVVFEGPEAFAETMADQAEAAQATGQALGF